MDAIPDKFISSDGHLVEPDDLWVTRMDQRFRERAPQPKIINGERTWIIEGALTVSTENAWVKAEQAKHEPALDLEGRHKTARPGGLDPHLRLLDQDMDHITAEVIYPGYALSLIASPDPEFQREAIKVYNTFLAEFCSVAPRRLIGAGLLPLRGPIEWAVEEAQRCARLGMPSVLVPAGAPKRSFNDPYWQPLWSELQDLNLVVAMHAGGAEVKGFDFSYQSMLPLSLLVDGKVVMLVRAILVRLLDHFWEDHRGWMEPRLHEPPSFYFHRQFYSTFEDDRAGLLTRELLNTDHLMWGSDYPHSEGTFPHSLEQVRKDFAGIPADLTRKLLKDNAASLYNIESR
jgi:predicted TIM-barrel fold metal-dependent hydrolase